MVRNLGIGCLFGMTLMVVSAGSAFAFGPVNAIAPTADAAGNVVNASFYGRPYPYGYSGWGPCVKYVQVQTRKGTKLRRVWSCR
jgi:hypothetical protein